MVILGIETSCDETAAAVVRNGTQILSNVVASSEEMHAKTGGIIPENAARKQIEYIIPVIQKALDKAFPKLQLLNSKIQKIDAIAVTAGGPGLIGSMLVGVETGKTLAYAWNKPIIPVVHLLAHVYANWLTSEQRPKFPAIVLTVSGGHSDLLHMKGHGHYRWLGGTRDDAAGEAFDKTARILGLPYPGGPSISKEADKYLKKVGSNNLKLFPRPMIGSEDLDFSFSGLKTSVKNYADNNDFEISKIAAEIQEAIADSLIEKSVIACNKYHPKTFLLAGGVAANKRLREKLSHRIISENTDIVFHVPEPKLCTDNATFVASYAFYNYNPVKWSNVRAIPNSSEAAALYGNYKDK